MGTYTTNISGSPKKKIKLFKMASKLVFRTLLRTKCFNNQEKSVSKFSTAVCRAQRVNTAALEDKDVAHSGRRRAQLIDGKAMAATIKAEIADEVTSWVAAGNRRPHLAAVLVGDDPASRTYIRNKINATKATGIESSTTRLEDTVSESELLQRIADLNADPNVDGILVQLPVPKHISERKVCNAVSPAKDVDGFHIINVGRFCVDLNSLIPATPAGVIEMIKRTGIETFGKNAVVCGRSKNVGMPIAMLLHADGIGEITPVMLRLLSAIDTHHPTS